MCEQSQCVPLLLMSRSGVETLRNNAKAHYNYANFLKDMDRKDAAISHYTAALR